MCVECHQIAIDLAGASGELRPIVRLERNDVETITAAIQRVLAPLETA